MLNAVVEPVITIFQKTQPTSEKFVAICVPRNTKLTSTFLNEGIKSEYIQTDLKKNPQYIFNYRSTKQEQELCESMQKYKRLDSMFEVMTGAKPYQKGKGTPPQTKEIVELKPYTSFEKKDASWVPYMRGRTIERFVNRWNSAKEYIKYGEWLAEPRDGNVFFGAKIFIRQTGDSLIATYDKGNVSNNTLHSIYPSQSNTNISLMYLLGILNSSLLNWYYKSVNYLEVGKPMAEVKGIYIRKLPIAIGNSSQTKIIENAVDSLLDMCQHKYETKQKFINYILKAYEPNKISERLDCFENLTFKDFLAELKKQKVRVSATQQMELLSLFEEQVNAIKEMDVSILEVQQLLDNTVFDIYQIPKESVEDIKSQIHIVL